MEELMKNNDTFIKLEELMYLSLVGKFAYIHTCDSQTCVCFTCTDDSVNKDLKARPIYITTLKVTNEATSKARINAFEKKIFNESFVEFLNRAENGEKACLCYSRRIKDYVNNVYSHAVPSVQKTIVNNYKNNFINLKNEAVLDGAQFEAGIEFVSRQLLKANEKTN